MGKYRFLRNRILVLAALAAGFYSILPTPLFTTDTATVLLDQNGKLLSASIAEDQQWRFPELDSIPEQLRLSILAFEDEYFEMHPGVNPFSIGRAIKQNISAGRVISGGSTITMQVVRLSRKNPPRTFIEKIWEMVLAIRLEFSYSKKEILNFYASHAPYGGNVVGAETASWRYFGRPLDQLSWSECATLAVLPNSPALIHPGRNRSDLKTKRNRLLEKLLAKNHIDSMTYELSLLEPIPEKPKPLPGMAYHLLQRAKDNEKKGQRIYSTLDYRIQKQSVNRVNRYVDFLSQNEVHNACALVVDINKMETIAYVGNSSSKNAQSKFVDITTAPRSSGSILKPLLYAKSIEVGIIHTNSILKDVPVVIDQFAPHNFDGEFEGIVRADEALARSLNVPAALLLRDYGQGIFYDDLKSMGFSTINRSAANYGLTLILGGAEVSLFDLATVYSAQAADLRNSSCKEITKLHYWKSDTSERVRPKIDRGAWWLITEALTQVQRPGINSDWKNYTSSRKVAWKTGTSFGFRDAWAVGYDKNYLIAVWVGNANGEGRPGLTGVSAAAPLMFDLFQMLPQTEWFSTPENSLKNKQICAESGYLPNLNCPKTEAYIPLASTPKHSCKFHKSIAINRKGLRVMRDCYNGPVRDTVMFDLDPVASYYYQQKHSKRIYNPRWDATCINNKLDNTVAIIYPVHGTDIIVPLNFRGEKEKIIFRATSKNSSSKLYWHLNENYLGETNFDHQMSLELKTGRHILKITDEFGNSSSCKFTAHSQKYE